jgi:hypothetical protein
MVLAWGAWMSSSPAASPPIGLHPENTRYFQWRERPTVLVSSAEHYGAVLNLDFDFRKYLDVLSEAGLNYTRIFSGSYVEPEGAFNITRNTLAPLPHRFMAPWARSEVPGYANGGNKFDLQRWNDTYFERLRAFVGYASERGVVVEMTLFCPMYEDKQWALSPMNAVNNIQGWGQVSRTNVHTLDRHGGLLAVQEALTRKLVTELNAFDNVIFELCNEPYFGGVTVAWQHRIADIIVETERGLPQQHLIAQNIANHSALIEHPHPAVGLFNFHYATPPDVIARNAHITQAFGDDETGFRGQADATYRTEGWDFMLAGGALYNNLDYSFAAGFEEGTFAYPAAQPGGGSVALRGQLRILKEFLEGFDFVKMRPDVSVIRGGVPPTGTVRALVQPGRAMAAYLRDEGPGGAKPPPSTGASSTDALAIDLAPGSWIAEWIDTRSGAVAGRSEINGGGVRKVPVPAFETDIALRLVRQ